MQYRGWSLHPPQADNAGDRRKDNEAARTQDFKHGTKPHRGLTGIIKLTHLFPISQLIIKYSLFLKIRQQLFKKLRIFLSGVSHYTMTGTLSVLGLELDVKAKGSNSLTRSVTAVEGFDFTNAGIELNPIGQSERGTTTVSKSGSFKTW